MAAALSLSLSLSLSMSLAACSAGSDQRTSPGPSVTGSSPGAAGSPGTSGPTRGAATEPTVVARGLPVPWGLAQLPDGSALVTLRDRADIVLVGAGAEPVSLGTVPGVVPGGEGGLLGMTLSPDFGRDATLFVYLTSTKDNRVLRMTYRDSALQADRVILDGIPKARNHDGGRLAFGPDGFLYVGTGDAGDGRNAQDRGSLGGKILRVTRDGAPAPGNPFAGSAVWSFGHRNVQGLAWDADGRMYASEFGQNTWDELNRIEPGRNYGWPQVEGRAGRSGLVDPLAQWTTAEASPSGIAVGADGAVYMAALRGESLWRIPLDDNGSVGTPERLLEGVHGRLRTVQRAADGRLWIVTSNTYRGDPRQGDDQVLILPDQLG